MKQIIINSCRECPYICWDLGYRCSKLIRPYKLTHQELVDINISEKVHPKCPLPDKEESHEKR